MEEFLCRIEGSPSSIYLVQYPGARRNQPAMAWKLKTTFLVYPKDQTRESVSLLNYQPTNLAVSWTSAVHQKSRRLKALYYTRRPDQEACSRSKFDSSFTPKPV